MTATMTVTRPDVPAMAIHVEETRARTAPRAPRGPRFADVARGGADVLLRGVEVGAGLVGGPALGAAVRDARGGLAAAISPGAPAGPLDATGGAAERSTLDEVRALQEQAQAFNAEYLALQEQVQQENRQFTTISNVLKAKHETAKMAIGNIRA